MGASVITSIRQQGSNSTASGVKLVLIIRDGSQIAVNEAGRGNPLTEIGLT